MVSGSKYFFTKEKALKQRFYAIFKAFKAGDERIEHKVKMCIDTFIIV